MKKFIAWSRVLGKGLSDEWEPNCDTYEAEDKEEALHTFINDEYSNLRAVNAIMVDERYTDGKVVYKYEYEDR